MTKKDELTLFKKSRSMCSLHGLVAYFNAYFVVAQQSTSIEYVRSLRFFLSVRRFCFCSTLMSFSMNLKLNHTLMTANRAKFSSSRSSSLSMPEECKCYAMCRKERIPMRMVWTCKWYLTLCALMCFFRFFFFILSLPQSNDRTDERQTNEWKIGLIDSV